MSGCDTSFATSLSIAASFGSPPQLLNTARKRIPFAEIFKNINWDVQWHFVLKKTIPFFWFPAHTITFLLPPDFRVLFAAVLGIALGTLLAFAGLKK